MRWGEGCWDVNVSLYSNAGFLLTVYGARFRVTEYTQSARLSVQSVELGPPTSSTQGSVATPLWVQGGDTLACGGGAGGTQFRRRDKHSNTLSVL
jgi:hypothetical protein